MDQTQLLDWDGEGDPDDPSDGTGEALKPVGRLHVLSSKYGPEKDFWIYPGENVIGRLPSCRVCLPVPSVSKAHAVIEVPSSDGPHLLYDRGSLNRTRRHRMVLIPEVRYSLQDGDTLLFGDVGCQYFTQAPGDTSESPEDSMEVPPTQPRVDASALAIEETPAPGKRKMDFGGVLVQDSDNEEGEEVVNGAGRILHLPGSDGTDSFIKDTAVGCSNVASSMFSSPSATVVPESDEEGEEPLRSDPSGASPCLPLKSHAAQPDPLENGAVTPSNQERRSAQPGATEMEVKAPPDTREPAAKEQGALRDPTHIDFHLDSDTDLEGEEGMGSASEASTSGILAKDDLALEVGSDTDVEEPAVVNPDASDQKNHQAAIDIGSDTDAEEAAGSPGPKADQPAGNGSGDTDVEEAIENPGVVSPQSQKPDSQNKDHCKGMEEADGNPDVARPKDHQLDEGGDSDTDVEEVTDDLGVRLKAQLAAENEDSDTDVEEASLKVDNTDGAQKNCRAAEDSDGDTDVEMPNSEMGDPNVALPQRPCPTSCKDSGANVEEVPIKEIVLQGVDYLTEGSGKEPEPGTNHAFKEMINPDTEPQRNHGASGERSKGLDVKEPTENLESVENCAALPQNQHAPMLSVDSDTDVVGVAESPPVDSKKNHTIAGDGPSGRDTESLLKNAGPQKSSGFSEDGSSDTDVEVTSSPRKAPVAQDSDTDVEEATTLLPGKPSEEQDTRLVPVGSWVDREKSATELRGCQEPCKEEDTDAEGNETLPEDESNTDDDPDLVFQATQCYLPAETSSPSTEKTRDNTAAGSSCALEEEPTQMFVCRSTPKPNKDHLGRACSSPLKDEDSDDSESCMLEATQSFCQEPEQLSEEPTQAFTAEEEEATERIIQHPPKAEDFSEQATQPTVPVLVPRVQQAASVSGNSAQPSTELPCSELVSQPAEGVAAEETREEEEMKPVGSLLSEQAVQSTVPVLASRMQQAANLSGNTAQPYSIALSCSEPLSQPVGYTGAKESHEEEEIQPAGSVPVPPVDSTEPLVLQEVKEVSRSQEKPCVVASEGARTAGWSETESGAGCADGEGRSATPSREAKDAEQLPKCATQKPSQPVASAPRRRCSLRSAAAASSASIPEGQSHRHGRLGSGGNIGPSEPVAPVTRRRGLRQLSTPAQYMGEPEIETEQPEGEEVSPNKKPKNGESTVAVCQNQLRRSSRESSAASRPKGETATAVDSPGAREPARWGKRKIAAEPVEKEQPELPRTRSSRRSGNTPVTTPSPKDSGKAAKPGQEPAQSTPASRKRVRHQSAESKPAGTKTQSQNRSQGSAAPGFPAPKVLFTGVIDEEGEDVVTELGGSLAKSVFDCTHLVTDRVRRTIKFLCALARGIPIVTLDWLEKSKRASSFLMSSSFLVHDSEQEKNFQFSLSKSLLRAQQEGGLLQGYEIHVTPNVKPEPEHMRDIVKCSGGTFLPRMPRAYKDKRIIISCPEDLPRCRPAQEAKIPIANSEFILTGILQQKVDLDAHRLDEVNTPSLASPAAPVTRASKRRATVLTTVAPPSTAKRRR